MRLKLDENVHGDARDALAGWGHDMATVRDEEVAGHPDAEAAKNSSAVSNQRLASG